MRLSVRNAEQLAMLWLPYNTDGVSQITIHVTSTMQVTTSPAKLQSDLHFAYSQLSVFTNNRYTVHTEIPYRFTDSYNHTSPLFTKTPHEGNQAIHFIHKQKPITTLQLQTNVDKEWTKFCAHKSTTETI